MKLVITDEDGEEIGELTGIDEYDLTKKHWADMVTAWISSTIKDNEEEK